MKVLLQKHLLAHLNTSYTEWLTEFPPAAFISRCSDMLKHPSPSFNCLPEPTAPLLPLSNVSPVSRNPTVASIVAVRAAPPVPCVMAASCPCWRTASMSPLVICVAKPATLMVWRRASPAPAGSTDTGAPQRAGWWTRAPLYSIGWSESSQPHVRSYFFIVLGRCFQNISQHQRGTFGGWINLKIQLACAANFQ